MNRSFDSKANCFNFPNLFRFNSSLLTLSTTILLFTFVVLPSQVRARSSESARTINLMSYNVENLFDAEHDAGKDDWTFLASNTPGKAEGCQHATTSFYRKECRDVDWTESKLNMKLDQIKRVVTGAKGQLPDLLALVEVENEKVVGKLAQKLGMKSFFVTNSPDQRGIDVALLFNTRQDLHLLNHYEYNMNTLNVITRKTRNILEVVFQVGENNQYLLSVFVNHWPSQANPTSDRMAIAQFLAQKVEERLKEPNHSVILLGDFNTLENETPHPIRSFLIGEGQQQLSDVGAERIHSMTSIERMNFPMGSHYFAKENSWSFLDKIMVSQDMLENGAGQNYDGENRHDGLKVLLSSFKVEVLPFATTSKGNSANGDKDNNVRIPLRYNFMTSDPTKAGFSDHLPLTVSLVY